MSIDGNPSRQSIHLMAISSWSKKLTIVKFKIFEKRIIGVPPIALGIDGDAVILPYTKPCHGTIFSVLYPQMIIVMVQKIGREKP